MKRRLRALMVDDSSDDVDLICLELGRSGFDVDFERVDNREALAEALERREWDLILTDHSMPTFNSEGVLSQLQHIGTDTPCIIVSGAIGESAAVAAMRNGAADYILKDSLARLGPAIERELREAEVRRQRKQAEDLVYHMAYHDPLTDLPNRTLFKDRFAQSLARARRTRQMLAVMFLDVDRFKNINDTLGHSVGDQMLQTVARRLAGVVREGDTISRWGGDEFTLLFPDVAHAEDAARIAQKVLDTLSRPIDVDGIELYVTASIGVALYPNDGDDVDTLLRNADTALFRVKEQNRNSYQLYTRSMNARAFERLAMETSLRHALERDELRVYYQPQVDIRTERVVGMEALARWQHPDLGLVFPVQFIPLAEETGLIVPLGLWVLREACRQNKAWQRMGLPPVRVAVNLSARQFQHRSLVQTVEEALQDSGLDANHLEIEITEGVAMHYASSTIAMLRDLRSMGITTAIDDFGTGYSSLGSINRFPFDKLKIDQSFIKGMTTDSEGAAIANTVITLAKSLDRRVIAEGVETREQFELLRERGCDEIQGYLFSPPVPSDQVPALISGGRLMARQSAR